MSELDVEPEDVAGAPEQSGFPSRWWHIRRPWVVVVLVALLVLASGFGYWMWSRQPERQLGDHGRVVGVVSPECMVMTIDKDGLHFSSNAGTPSTYTATPDDEKLRPSGTIPVAWYGTSVPGTLEVVEVHGGNDMLGRFTAEDGTVITLLGGRSGTVFDYLSCAISGE
jgi:hypothetical protein